MAFIAMLVMGVVCLNYLTIYSMTYEHAFYRVLPYIPLILGSFWFGIKGALIIATSMVLLFVPYVMAHWHGFSLEDFHEILEGVLYLAIALILGILVEREKKRHKALVEYESLAAVGRAVSEVAHDMKTPLMAIGGFAAQVSRALEINDPRQKKLDIIVHETGRLETMVRQMLDFGKPTELELETVNLNDLVRETADSVRPVAEKARVIVDTALDPLLHPLLLDGPKIKGALLNLVVNAVEASPEGKHVLIRTAGDKQGVELYIIDNGIGIGQEDLERVFEPLKKKKKKGAGLGLPIVKKIVEAHRGTIHLEQNDGGGVVFTVRFPTKLHGEETQNPGPGQAGRLKDKGSRNRTILSSFLPESTSTDPEGTL